MAYRHLTGDGPEGGQLEAKASVSAGGVFDPRLALTGNAEGSLGIGENDYSSWGLSGGIRFASGRSRRGFGLELDTRLDSLENGGIVGSRCEGRGRLRGVGRIAARHDPALYRSGSPRGRKFPGAKPLARTCAMRRTRKQSWNTRTGSDRVPSGSPFATASDFPPASGR